MDIEFISDRPPPQTAVHAKQKTTNSREREALAAQDADVAPLEWHKLFVKSKFNVNWIY